MTEEERYRLEDRRVLAMEKFYRQEAVCQRMGGVMEIGLRSLGTYSYQDYKSAKCVRNY